LPGIPQRGYREIRQSTSIKPVQRQGLQPSDPWQPVRRAAKLKDYPFYPAAQAEFHSLAGRPAEAAKQFEKSHEGWPAAGLKRVFSSAS